MPTLLDAISRAFGRRRRGPPMPVVPLYSVHGLPGNWPSWWVATWGKALEYATIMRNSLPLAGGQRVEIRSVAGGGVLQRWETMINGYDPWTGQATYGWQLTYQFQFARVF